MTETGEETFYAETHITLSIQEKNTSIEFRVDWLKKGGSSKNFGALRERMGLEGVRIHRLL